MDYNQHKDKKLSHQTTPGEQPVFICPKCGSLDKSLLCLGVNGWFVFCKICRTNSDPETRKVLP
jgi:transcription elongation factor Elf1